MAISSAPSSTTHASTSPIIGVDIGGTKCAVSVLRDERVEEIGRFSTRDFDLTFADLVNAIRPFASSEAPRFGISCGGPLDATAGTILTPPNLPPSWHGVPIVKRLTERFGGAAALMNDANACALAEWRFGAGRGTQHMIFLTCGTGMGGGLVLNGRLYEGATGDAGEIGHVRLRADGPVGYGKAGSVEGFTSGGGISRLAQSRLAELASPPAWVTPDVPLTTKQIAEAAQRGDAFAHDVMQTAGEHLGETLAILIDLFNPQRIVIGGIFPRCEPLLRPAMERTMQREALPLPLAACTIVPAELGETIGSHGAICVALDASA